MNEREKVFAARAALVSAIAKDHGDESCVSAADLGLQRVNKPYDPR